jgi:hypothetical protein
LEKSRFRAARAYSDRQVITGWGIHNSFFIVTNSIGTRPLILPVFLEETGWWTHNKLSLFLTAETNRGGYEK